MKILCVFGRHNYGNPNRGVGYEYANFLPALRALGHEVVFFDSLDRSAWPDFAALNGALLQTVERERPDVVFFVLMMVEVWTETLQALRVPGGPALMHWATDDTWKYEQFSRHLAPYFDLYCTTAASALEKSRRDCLDSVALSQWAANGQALTAPLAAGECRFDVSFVGSAYGNRPRWIDALRARGIEVSCFGHGWPNGTVRAEEIPQILRASRISLNFGDSPPLSGPASVHTRQIKARVFEVPGAGGMLLTENAPELERYYRIGEEIAVYDDADDLAAKVRGFLAQPALRDAMAQRGFARTRAEHTYEMRFAPLLQAALARRQRRSQGSGAPSDARAWRVDQEGFERAARAHAVSPGLRALRALLVAPLRPIWGPVRAQRAARRLVFEASWRLSGVRAYGARGLTGRLFYEQC